VGKAINAVDVVPVDHGIQQARPTDLEPHQRALGRGLRSEHAHCRGKVRKMQMRFRAIDIEMKAPLVIVQVAIDVVWVQPPLALFAVPVQAGKLSRRKRSVGSEQRPICVALRRCAGYV
jgi:hypothetical protein